VESKKLLFVFSGKNEYGCSRIAMHDASGDECREHSRAPLNIFL
jgi:hypothetical protein